MILLVFLFSYFLFIKEGRLKNKNKKMKKKNSKIFRNLFTNYHNVFIFCITDISHCAISNTFKDRNFSGQVIWQDGQKNQVLNPSI